MEIIIAAELARMPQCMGYNISVQGEELELQKIMPLIHPSRHFSGEMISNSFRKC